MSQLPRYESYKDSGVQWLGEIPSHWDVKRMKFVVANVGDKIDAKESDLRYFGLENIESFTGKLLDSVELESEGIGHRFQKDDVLFGKLRPYLAKVFLAQEEGLSSTEALVFRSSEVIYPKFLSYYCLSQDFINEVNGTTFGSKMPRASWDDISSFRMVYPSLAEQKIIADFLDKRLAQVDALIAKQETLLEKLAEQRVALISHAVTKGLNPDVEMKVSGVDYLGKLPSKWKVVKLARIFSIKAGGDVQENKFSRECLEEYPYPIYTNANDAGSIYGYTNEARYPKNSITVSGRGDVGFAVYRDHSFDAIIRLLVMMPYQKVDCRYYTYLINAVIDFQVNSSAVSQLSTLQISPYKVPLFSEIDQKEIADYLDAECGKIDGMVKVVERTIIKLQEYRSTLITQVVAGKIDVRNLKVN